MADYLAIAIIVSIPWSTSATLLLIGVWLIVVSPGLSQSDVRLSFSQVSSLLPILIVVLAVVGLFWTHATPHESFAGLRQISKLLMIPILFSQFRTSENGKRAILGFLISCLILLVLSIGSALWPVITWWHIDRPGVPFKNQTTQSAEFAICAFCLLPLALNAKAERRYVLTTVILVGIVAFLGDIFYVATSRTELVTIGVLAVLVFFKLYKWKGLPIGLSVVGVLALGLWYSSPYLQSRIRHGDWEVREYLAIDKPTSIGLRLDWWRQSIDYWKNAPIFGHGTGSVEDTFRVGAETRGVDAQNFVTTDPHNQTLDFAVQFGFVGVALLFAMWIAHLALFRGSTLVDWFGLVVVVQNIVGSVFNSHITNFTEGWIYVFGVGLLGGLIQRHKLQPGGSLDSVLFRIWPK